MAGAVGTGAWSGSEILNGGRRYILVCISTIGYILKPIALTQTSTLTGEKMMRCSIRPQQFLAPQQPNAPAASATSKINSLDNHALFRFHPLPPFLNL